MTAHTYGNLVARARLATGLTQKELAEDIQVKRETVSRWERDKLIVTPPAAEMHRLCRRLPDLTELELLASLGYNLGPLIDGQGRLMTAEDPFLEASLSAGELLLVRNFRRLPDAARPVIQFAIQGVVAQSHRK